MAPRETPSFYLFSTGYHPDQITLGSLVFHNYTTPDIRCATFPKIDEANPESQSLVFTQDVKGCWASKKHSKYGFGIEAIALAKVSSEFAKSCNKVVYAEEGRRVVLRDPMEFFSERVIHSPAIRKKLAIWLTTAKSSYLFKTATFQKPKVYCVTGFYELRGVRAFVDRGRDFSGKFEVSSAVLGAATGIPIGATIGPFEDGKSIIANVEMPNASIWAARFHQLDVGYLQMAVDGGMPLPTAIKLRPDVTNPGGGLMAGEPANRETRTLEGSEVRKATVVTLMFRETVEEIEDAEDGEYWEAFEKAEGRLKEDAEDSSDDEE